MFTTVRRISALRSFSSVLSSQTPLQCTQHRFKTVQMKPKVFVTRSDYAKVGLEVLEKE